MDQHPIPQDVTGFQFKLIGTMTVKQFGYVASGVIMAVILYYLPINGVFAILMKMILIPLFGGSGVVIAFVPIEGRPVDVMATNFFKAVFSPNQYVYRKSGRKFSFSTITLTKAVPATQQAAAKQNTPAAKQESLDKKSAQLQAYLRTSHNQVKNDLDKKELTMLSSLALPKAAPAPVAVAAPIPSQPPTPQVQPVITAPAPVQAVPAVQPKSVSVAEEQSLIQKETAIQQQLQTAKQEEITTHAPAAHQKVTAFEKQLQEIHAQKQQLEMELLRLKSQLSNSAIQSTQHVVAASSLTTPVSPSPSAASMPQNASNTTSQQTPAKTAPKKGDLPSISDTPNVVVGIVKDPRGNILPNMLVEVKDKDNNPIRAFKTNALGQFASATPLAKGTYTVEIEDPKKQHSFDVIQLMANDQIMPPIEVVSHDAREELRKQLFN